MLPCEQCAAAGYSCKSTHQLVFGMKENLVKHNYLVYC